MGAWLGSHEKLLREHFRTRGAAWCAEQTGHTKDGVYRKAQLLGVARRKADERIHSTPQIDLMIRNAYGAGRIGACKAIAKATGMPVRWVSSRAHELSLRLRGATEAAFTPEQLAHIAERMHVSARAIAQELRERFGWSGSQRMVAAQLTLLRRDRDDDERMTASQVAEIFGVTLTTVTRWIKRGWLIAEKVEGYGHGSRIDEADLGLFAANHPSAYTLGKLEGDKAWFIDLVVRHGRYEGRQDGTLVRRIRSVAAACPEMGRDEIAALFGCKREKVTTALNRPKLVEMRRAA